MEINLISSGIEGCDEDIVDDLVDIGMDALSKGCLDQGDSTTPSEIALACFMILRKVLKGIRNEEISPEESSNNKKEIKRVLEELSMELAATIH